MFPAYPRKSLVMKKYWGTFKEEDVHVGTGEWKLPGTLTVPKTSPKKRVPGLVLVHGSGPNDRDETVGPNRPFKDLAWGLASRGIAVLRYDKRTKVHRSKIKRVEKTFTVWQETVDDALIAAAKLRRDPRIDPRRVVVLGHHLLDAARQPRIGVRGPW